MPMVPQPSKAPPVFLWSLAGVKVVAILLMGLAIGSITAAVSAQEVEDVRTMTQEEYAEGFEEYRNATLAMDMSWWGHVVMMMLVLGGALVFYELLTWAAGWAVSIIFQPKPKPFVTADDSSPFESY